MFFQRHITHHKKKLIKPLIVIIDIVALLMFLAFILNCYNITVYIVTLYKAGSITLRNNWLDCILYYISGTYNYLGFSVIIFCLGQLIKDARNLNQETNQH